MKMTVGGIAKMFDLSYATVDWAVAKTFDKAHIRRGERYEVSALKPVLTEIAQTEIDKNFHRMMKWKAAKRAIESYDE